MPDPVQREQTVGDYLAEAMPAANPRSRQRLVKFQRVLVNGVPAQSAQDRLRPGDSVSIEEPRPPAESPQEQGTPALRPVVVPARAEPPRTRAPRKPDRGARSTREGQVGRTRGPKPRPSRPRDQERAGVDPGPGGGWLRGGLRVVHEDGDLIVVDKPAGMVTASPVPLRTPTAFDILKQHAARGRRPGSPRGRAGGRERDRVWVIHRLDKEASGLLVFAKSLRAFEVLKEELRSKRVHRLYMALAEGRLGEAGASGTMQSFLKEDPTGRVSSLDAAAYRGPPSRPRKPLPPGERDRDAERDDPAKLAVTHYRVVAAGNDLTLAQVRLETGRKHQIRVHFADRGHPLVGDERYGAVSNPIHRLGLHAVELGFAHPATGQSLRFSSPAPASFYRAVGATPPASAPEDAAPAPIPAAPAARRGGAPAAETSWDDVAEWYDELLSERGSDHYERVILPGALRLLEVLPGKRVLDVASGQGIVSRRLAALGAEVTGVEASPRLVEAASRRSAEEADAGAGAGGRAEYRVGDARELGALGLSGFDAAACVMALGNIDPLEPVFRGVAGALKPGGAFVMVISHPAFRAPRQTSWGWDEAAGTQYRRVDGYLSPGQAPIEMHPGRKARGEGSSVTLTFHRPIQAYVQALGAAGFVVERLEEWPGQRVSTAGPRAAEENRARREIPLFLAIRAVKPA